MFERLNIAEIGGIGFIITPLVRHNVYKNPQLLNEWSGSEFKDILNSIKSHLKPLTEIEGMWSIKINYNKKKNYDPRI